MQALRRLGLAGTELAQAQCHTLRLQLFKSGTLVRINSAEDLDFLVDPYAQLFSQIWQQLQQAPLRC